METYTRKSGKSPEIHLSIELSYGHELTHENMWDHTM